MANEFDDLNKEIAELTALQKGLAAEKADGGTSTDAFTAYLSEKLSQASKGLGNWAKSVADGDTSFSSLNAVIDIATNALANMAKAIPLAGGGLSQAAKAAGEAGKFMLGQLDSTTKAFNQMGQVAATGAKGMSGLQQQFTTARLPLETFTKMVGDNAATFARWKDTTAEGTDAFSEIVGELTDKGDMTLRRLGMSATQIGQTTAAFIAQQTQLGRAQKMTNAELIASTKAYAIDLDQLQKLTGQSAGSIQAQQAKMLNQARFRANIDEMVNDGRGDQARSIQNLQTEFAGFNEEMGQGIADIVSGTSETGTAGGKLMASTGGAALDIINRVKNKGLTTAEASIEMKKAMQKEQVRTRETAKQIDSTTSGQLEQSAVSDAVASLDTNAAKRAKTTQKKQLDKSDDLTESTIKAQQQMENMNMELQKLGFQALPYAADAVDAVAVTIDKAVEFIMDRLNGSPSDAIAREAENRRVAGAGGSKSSAVGGGATVVGGGGGEGDAGAIMEAAANAPAPAAKTAAAPNAASPAKPGEAGPAGPKGDLANKIMMAESGGKNINNQSGAGGKATSSATGLFQFTKGTFEDLVKNAKSDSPLYGKTFEDYKQNTTLQYEAMNMLMEKNAGALSRRGIETTDANMYLAHFLGAGGAAKALLAGPNAPLTDVMSKEQLDANPSLKSMRTVADLQAWADKKMGGGEATPGKTREAAEGALLSGPQQGYNPNKSMAGVDIKPLNKQAMDAATSANGQTSIDPQMFGLQMEQLDLLIASARNQLAVKQRILKAKV
jgi:transposase